MARPKMVHAGVVFKEVSITAPEIAAGGNYVISESLSGLRSGHPVLVWCPNLPSGVVMHNAYAGKNLLYVTLANITSTPITPGALTYYVVQL